MASPHKCARCADPRSRQFPLCQKCWPGVPRQLKRQWHEAADRQALIRAANAIFRWVATELVKFPAGLAYDRANDAVHFNVLEYLRQQGLPPTEANVEAAMAEWREVAAREFPDTPHHVITRDDLNPE